MFPEADMIWMSVLVFLPSIFALALIFFPRGSEKWMWVWSLAGTAFTLGISISIFINFKTGVIDVSSFGETSSVTRARLSLDRSNP